MNLPQRKSARLKGFDYATAGAYFVTICTHNRECSLSGIVEEVSSADLQCIVGEGFPLPSSHPTSFGKITEGFIGEIPQKYPSVSVLHYVLMPNHIHLIISINSDLVLDSGRGNPSPTLSMVLGWFKYQTSKAINDIENCAGKKRWQRSYHDHIIRDEKEYNMIWEYIDTNPIKWQLDRYYSL